MDTSTLGRGELIAAASAIALFLIMFIFDWFGYESVGANAWQSFGLIDLVLLITIIAAVGAAAMSAGQGRIELPASPAAIVTGLGLLSVLLVLFRIINPPDLGFGAAADAFGVDIDVGRKVGAFLGLIAAGGITYGGWQAMQEEGGSPAPRRDRRRPDREPGPPPG